MRSASSRMWVTMATIRPVEPSSSMAAATTSSVPGSSEPKPSSRKIDSIIGAPSGDNSLVASARASARDSEARNVSPPDNVRALRSSSALAWSRTMNSRSTSSSENCPLDSSRRRTVAASTSSSRAACISQASKPSACSSCPSCRPPRRRRRARRPVRAARRAVPPLVERGDRRRRGRLGLGQPVAQRGQVVVAAVRARRAHRSLAARSSAVALGRQGVALAHGVARAPTPARRGADAHAVSVAQPAAGVHRHGGGSSAASRSRVASSSATAWRSSAATAARPARAASWAARPRLPAAADCRRRPGCRPRRSTPPASPRPAHRRARPPAPSRRPAVAPDEHAQPGDVGRGALRRPPGTRRWPGRSDARPRRPRPPGSAAAAAAARRRSPSSASSAASVSSSGTPSSSASSAASARRAASARAAARRRSARPAAAARAPRHRAGRRGERRAGSFEVLGDVVLGQDLDLVEAQRARRADRQQADEPGRPGPLLHVVAPPAGLGLGRLGVGRGRRSGTTVRRAVGRRRRGVASARRAVRPAGPAAQPVLDAHRVRARLDGPPGLVLGRAPGRARRRARPAPRSTSSAAPSGDVASLPRRRRGQPSWRRAR